MKPGTHESQIQLMFRHRIAAPFLTFLLGVCVLVFMVVTVRQPYTKDFQGVPDFVPDNCAQEWPPKDGNSYKEFPKHIHQVWDTKEFPEEWRFTQKSCIEKYPDWKYTLWTFDDIENLIQEHHPWLLSTWHTYPYDMQRVDVVKYLVLYHFGGLYMDLDVSCLESFEPILKNISANKHTVVRPSYPSWYGLDTLLSKPKSPLMWYALTNMPLANRWYGVPYTTVMFGAGTAFFGLCVNSYPCREHIEVVPNHYLTQKYFLHHHASSWHHWDGHIILFFYQNYRVIIFSIFLFSLFVTVVYAYYRRKLAYRYRASSVKKPSNGLYYS